MSAVVLLGHGSRAPGASESMERVAKGLGDRLGAPVRVAHMELAEPSLETVLEELYAQGEREVTLVPYFLHHGIHLREDIPGILAGCRERLTGIDVRMAPHLGYDDALVDVVARRLEQAVPLEPLA